MVESMEVFAVGEMIKVKCWLLGFNRRDTRVSLKGEVLCSISSVDVAVN
jgi:hypothetical protein